MKILITSVIFLTILSACNQQKKINENISEPFRSGQIVLSSDSLHFFPPLFSDFKNSRLSDKNANADNVRNQLSELTNNLTLFGQNREKKQLQICQNIWRSINSTEVLNDTLKLIPWIKVTSKLFLVTGDPIYMDDLENVLIFFDRSGINSFRKSIIKEVEPVIFSKDVDNVYVNLYFDSSVSFEHTFGGKIKIEQKINPDKRGEINLKFTMGEKQYIELFIRIPWWVGQAEVEAGKVKYVAIPGEYCKIARKWNNGDQVNIRFTD